MDYSIESPFSFDLGDELFPLPSLSSLEIPAQPQLPSNNPPLGNSNGSLSQKPKNGRRKKPPPISSDNSNNNVEDEDETPNDHKKRKIIHRDVERQRRQEMSTLYTALRSLLPLEYLKGKRSICDHMLETVKYIRYMQSRIQELSDKRDELKKVYSDDSDGGRVQTLNASKRDFVMVRPRKGGVQVVLDTAAQHLLPVSYILQALIAEGLDIFSCISTKINDRFLHTIESQAVNNNDGDPIINLSDLQNKLTNLEYFQFV